MIKTVLVSFLFIIFTISASAKCKTENCGLVVRGKVTDLEIDHYIKDYVGFIVSLEVELKNESDEPIILFKPYVESQGMKYYWLGGRILRVEKDEKPIYIEGQWESVMGSPSYRKLAEKLDTKTPSEEYTKILQPNETWKFEDKTFIRFSEKIEKYSFSNNKSWEEMQELPSKLWLTISYELNPWNVEYFKPKLLRKLRKRWKKFGNIPIGKFNDSEFSHFNISSEPMMIDFSKAKDKTTKAK